MRKPLCCKQRGQKPMGSSVYSHSTVAIGLGDNS